jgi:hypothetical protein
VDEDGNRRSTIMKVQKTRKDDGEDSDENYFVDRGGGGNQPRRNTERSSAKKPKREGSRGLPEAAGKKRLPKNFAEQVLGYEADIDSGKFTADTVNQLLQLYQAAVEFYNG